MIQRLKSVRKLTRDEVVPYYVKLITDKSTQEEIERVNKLILSKWKRSGLSYIKDKAWRQVALGKPLGKVISVKRVKAELIISIEWYHDFVISGCDENAVFQINTITLQCS